jgi:DNA repair photolyase
MPIIYEPRGKAREYSDLAVNLNMGCSHACRYYCPATPSVFSRCSIRVSSVAS